MNRSGIGKTRNCMEARPPKGGVFSYNFEFSRLPRVLITAYQYGKNVLYLFYNIAMSKARTIRKISVFTSGGKFSVFTLSYVTRFLTNQRSGFRCVQMRNQRVEEIDDAGKGCKNLLISRFLEIFEHAPSVNNVALTQVTTGTEHWRANFHNVYRNLRSHKKICFLRMLKEYFLIMQMEYFRISDISRESYRK